MNIRCVIKIPMYKYVTLIFLNIIHSFSNNNVAPTGLNGIFIIVFINKILATNTRINISELVAEKTQI